MKLEELTIVLPTKNEAHNITPFLLSTLDATPLIVVDASDDHTSNLIEATRPINTKIVHSRAHIAEARNIGAALAETSWILFTDADISFAPDYFERLQSYNGIAALYGPKLSQQEFATYYRWFSRGQQLLALLKIPAASGSNLLVHRETFLSVGGFDRTLTCNEDSELAWRLTRCKHRVVFAPDLIVYERDHRRLRRGVVRKTAHSIVRCLFLFTGLMPVQLRHRDWGYWS
jgi:glycosyltransferase involved in cell wall biosynthesis